MARVFGDKAQIFVALGASAPTPPTGKIADCRDFEWPDEPAFVDRSSNDTRRDAQGVRAYNGDLKFKVTAVDRADAGQAVLFTAVSQVKAGTGDGVVSVVFYPEGTGSGLPKETFTANVTLGRAYNRDNYINMDVTLKPIGDTTPGTQ